MFSIPNETWLIMIHLKKYQIGAFAGYAKSKSVICLGGSGAIGVVFILLGVGHMVRTIHSRDLRNVNKSRTHALRKFSSLHRLTI